MIGFCPLASGSKGNSLYLGTPEVKLLIDAGLSAKALVERLSTIGVDIADIDAILITHEHNDHISALKVLAYKMGIPLFCNKDTAKGIATAFQAFPKATLFSTGETFTFRDLEIHPFSIQHDTLDPVAFRIDTGSYKIGICTDLGFVTSQVRKNLEGCQLLYVEANHQPSMVHASPRSYVYKDRVLSRYGHLSNEECGELLCDIWHPEIELVYLAHLSSECNSPETALQVVSHKLREKGLELSLTTCPQETVSRAFHFTPSQLLI